MIETPARKFDLVLARVLQIGTIAASLVIAIGLVLPNETSLVTIGIGLFIALPVVRVALMLIEFLRRKDFRIGAIAALVLMVILLAAAVGVKTNRRAE